MDKLTTEMSAFCRRQTTNLDLPGQRIMAWMPWVLGMNV